MLSLALSQSCVICSTAVSQERLLINSQIFSLGSCSGILLQYVTDAVICVLCSVKARAYKYRLWLTCDYLSYVIREELRNNVFKFRNVELASRIWKQSICNRLWVIDSAQFPDRKTTLWCVLWKGNKKFYHDCRKIEEYKNTITFP